MHQWCLFKANPSTTEDLKEGTGMMPGEHSHTRIKPLALASGHGRHITITVTPERALVSVGEWPLPLHIAVTFLDVSLPKPPCNGRFNSETSVWRFQKKNFHLDPEVA